MCFACLCVLYVRSAGGAQVRKEDRKGRGGLLGSVFGVRITSVCEAASLRWCFGQFPQQD